MSRRATTKNDIINTLNPKKDRCNNCEKWIDKDKLNIDCTLRQDNGETLYCGDLCDKCLRNLGIV